MSTSIQFGPADRDDRGFVKAPAPSDEPRSLADLLPTPQSIQADAQRKPATKAEQALLAIVALITISIFIWRLGFSGEARPAAPLDAPAATQTSGDSTAMPSPLPVVMLSAYSAPDVPLGQIEATRAITPTAHYGQDWIQAIVQGSGRIWLRASDWPALAIVGPDLAPPPTAAPAVFTPEPTAPPRCETEADIRYTTERDVIIEGLSRGHVIGRSCASQDEANANADAQAQVVIAIYRANPTPTTVPAPTPMPLTQKGHTP